MRMTYITHIGEISKKADEIIGLQAGSPSFLSYLLPS